MVFCSCTIYHFENPLPADSQNIKAFPKSLQGIWFNEDGEPKFKIKKNSIELLGYNNMPKKIYKGTIDSASVRKNFFGLKHIQFDDVKNRLDTVLDFIVKDNKIYGYIEGSLTFGIPFLQVNDTLVVQDLPREKLTQQFQFKLGEDYFLRKVSDTQYVMNMVEKNFFSKIGQNSFDHWYQIFVFDKLPDGRLDFKSADNFPDSVKIYKDDDNTFLNCQWNKKQVKQAIQNKYFESFFMLYEQKDKRLDSIRALPKGDKNKIHFSTTVPINNEN